MQTTYQLAPVLVLMESIYWPEDKYSTRFWKRGVKGKYHLEQFDVEKFGQINQLALREITLGKCVATSASSHRLRCKYQSRAAT